MIRKFLGTVIYGGAIALGAHLMTTVINNASDPYQRAKLRGKLDGVRHKFKVIKKES